MRPRWDLAVAAEAWERPLAWATAAALAGELPPGGEVRMPGFLAPAPSGFAAPVRFVDTGPGFAERAAVRSALDSDHPAPVLSVWPGVLPADGATEAGHWLAWRGPLPVPALSARLAAPVHAPPVVPRHRREMRRGIEVVRVDCGHGWFDSAGAGLAGERAWLQYGADAPIFVYNTNRFDEPAPPPAQVYAVLASGMLGLRLVLDSKPPPGARLVVFDINPHQLSWSRFLIGGAGRFETFEALVDAFAADNPGVSIRPTAPHEQDNARAQQRWYAGNRHRIASLGALDPIFLELNLLADPAPLLRQMKRGMPAFLMYLDLFTVWHMAGPNPWIADLRDMAAALERRVSATLGPDVTFCPGAQSQVLQLHDVPPVLADGG